MKFPLYPLTALIFVLGVGLFAYSWTLPYYNDQAAADALHSQSYDIPRHEYFEKEAELRTSKPRLMDIGAGLAITVATLLLFLGLSRVKSYSDLRELKTPCIRCIYVLSNLAWLLLLPAISYYFKFRGKRGDYPPFADSIVIPIVVLSIAVVALIIPLNLLILLTTIKSDLPAKLLSKFSRHSTASILWGVFWGCLLLVSIAGFADAVANGNHIAIPVSMYFIYLVLCLRAGKVSRLNRKLVETLAPKNN
jgi:hypothetical protein